ncbi:hypothetical protein CDD80_2700 [Ophiocordyceps camponoti-rufipedis]|uniref:Uncharacterized protein n=1 Tax=Ophiocordyceps camponoti-rufipedis TaxID=2004952 RepID=A0A2C5YZK0_9HYPO|nr:hypothetical protein CDD80_2700 [Ophiocordyceps camponoti-rufipedis]
MENRPLAASRPAANLFDIYNDTPRVPPVQPGGGCNFSDLHSPLGLKCGCRRFYPRHQPPEQAGWCMCSHHACYHDQGPPDDIVLPFSSAAGQENEPQRTGREPLSPVPGSEWKAAVDLAASPLSFVRDRPVELDCRSVAEISLPDTLAWGEATVPPGSGTPILPPIPSQCLLSSQATTASSAQGVFLRPFGGKGLHTLRATESSPRPRGSPADNRRPDSHQTSTRAEPRSVGPLSLDALMDLTSAVGDHGRRLDRLETTSFHGDCHDRLDNAEVRVYELESRVEEVEKLAGDGGSAVTSRASGPDDVVRSRPSMPSEEVESQLQSLQEQVSMLQSYLPSPRCPLELDVVFLPFPLKKLWQRLPQFNDDYTTPGGDDWAQLTLSKATRRSQSPFVNEWTSRERDTEWLLPRACKATSVIAQRLRSRGLMQTIQVSSPDYRSVQAAVDEAFEGVLGQMGIAPRFPPPELLGLHQRWVPLRKIHRDSRLRFLSPADMVTPVLWNAQFLGSVTMRSPRQTLFITHPDGYLQDRQAFSKPWTWKRVREMERVYEDGSDSPEADASEEECWAWSEQLDGPRPPPIRSYSVQRPASPSVARQPTPIQTSVTEARRVQQRTEPVPITERMGFSDEGEEEATANAVDQHAATLYAPMDGVAQPVAVGQHLQPPSGARRDANGLRDALQHGAAAGGDDVAAQRDADAMSGDDGYGPE